jgi:hypothetical protein
MGSLYSGLLGRIAEALDNADRAALEAVLRRNLLPEAEASDAAALADYVLAESRRLAALPAGAIVSGAMGTAA